MPAYAGSRCLRMQESGACLCRSQVPFLEKPKYIGPTNSGWTLAKHIGLGKVGGHNLTHKLTKVLAIQAETESIHTSVRSFQPLTPKIQVYG